MKTILVCKFGGSLIAHKSTKILDIKDLLNNQERYIRFDVLKRISEEAFQAINFFQKSNLDVEIWFSHGVGVYGHPIVEAYGVSGKVNEYTNFLNEQVVKTFLESGVDVVSLDASKTVIPEKNTFNIDEMAKGGEKIISDGKIPFAYGTVVGARQKRIFSADDFVETVASRLDADKALMFMDEFLSTEDPKKNPNARPLKELRNLNELTISVDSLDKTGGLLEKIIKLQRLKRSAKTRCRIVNGMVKGNIYKALIGEDVPAEILL